MADQKTTALTELTTFSGDETFYVVEDDDGTPVSRRVTIENLAAGLASYLGLTQASSSGPGSLDLFEDTDNGTNKARVIAPASMAADRTQTLPDATGTIALDAARTARVYRSAALSLANNGTTAVAFDAESWDTDTLHDNSTNPSRVVLNKVGKWQVDWQLVYAANGTGVRDASLMVNGAVVAIRELLNSGGSVGVYVHGSDIVNATAITDYVEIQPFQNSGGSLAFTVGATNCWLSVAFLGT